MCIELFKVIQSDVDISNWLTYAWKMAVVNLIDMEAPKLSNRICHLFVTCYCHLLLSLVMLTLE